MFQWDLSLCAPPRRATVWKRKWLVEDGNDYGTKLRSFPNKARGIRGDSNKSFSMNHGVTRVCIQLSSIIGKSIWLVIRLWAQFTGQK